MTNQSQLGDLLRATADHDPLEPIDADRLRQRGDRGLRRRRIAGTTGAVAAIGAVAVGAAWLPGLGAADAPPPTAGPAERVVASASSKPAGPRHRVAPGADDATVLRACSAKLAKIKAGTGGELRPSAFRPKVTDLTGWRMVTRMVQPRVGTVFVATSPAGDQVATCELYAPGLPDGLDWGSHTSSGPAYKAPGTLTPHLFGEGVKCAASLRCSGWLYTEYGRVPTKITRLHLTAKNGRSVDVPVRNGWYAVMWADGDPNGAPPGAFTAYDAAGNVVKTDPDFVRKLMAERAKRNSR